MTKDEHAFNIRIMNTIGILCLLHEIANGSNNWRLKNLVCELEIRLSDRLLHD